MCLCYRCELLFSAARMHNIACCETKVIPHSAPGKFTKGLQGCVKLQRVSHRLVAPPSLCPPRFAWHNVHHVRGASVHPILGYPEDAGTLYHCTRDTLGARVCFKNTARGRDDVIVAAFVFCVSGEGVLFRTHWVSGYFIEELQTHHHIDVARLASPSSTCDLFPWPCHFIVRRGWYDCANLVLKTV